MPAVQAALLRPEHALVNLAGKKWRWSEEEQWPPIESVLAAPLWTLERYEPLRARLRSPAPG